MTAINSLPDLIIWDWDGTLVDTLPVIFKAQNHVCRQLGLKDFTYDEFLIAAHKSSRESFKDIYGEAEDKALELFIAYMQENHINGLSLYKNSLDLLNKLQTINTQMILVSNKRELLLNKEIDHLNTRKYFKSIVGAGEAITDKPSDAPVNLALNQANISLNSIHNAWFIGDSQTDIDCAKNLNFKTKTIIVGNHNTKGEDIRFKSLLQLHDFISEIC